MAQESCNLDKDEAELLKPPPSASSSAPAPPPPAAAAASPTLYLKPPSQEQQQPQQQHLHLHQQQLGSRVDAAPKPDGPTNPSTRKRKLETPPPPVPPEADAFPAVAVDCIGKAQKVESTPGAPSAAAKSTVNRCSCCQKRVGLTGFRCRCGDLFCAQHRYSDAHGCSYDYKAAGRAEISKANPVVRAPKIIKI